MRKGQITKGICSQLPCSPPWFYPTRCQRRTTSCHTLVHGTTQYWCSASIAASLTPTTRWLRRSRPLIWNTGAPSPWSSRIGPRMNGSPGVSRTLSKVSVPTEYLHVLMLRASIGQPCAYAHLLRKRLFTSPFVPGRWCYRRRNGMNTARLPPYTFVPCRTTLIVGWYKQA